MSTYKATIQERGNGFAGTDEYVTENGNVYRIVSTYGQIHTGQSGSGAPNWINAIVEDADWSDIDDDNEPYCTAVIGDALPIDIGSRVAAGEGEDHDTGRVERFDDSETAFVAWDSGVKTPADVSELTAI